MGKPKPRIWTKNCIHHVTQLLDNPMGIGVGCCSFDRIGSWWKRRKFYIQVGDFLCFGMFYFVIVGVRLSACCSSPPKAVQYSTRTLATVVIRENKIHVLSNDTV